MIFVDTWAWVGLAVKRDQFHQPVKQTHAQLRKRRRKYVTSDYVVSELITYLYNVGPVPTAQGFINALLASVDSGDFTSMVVMQDLGVTEIFTGDGHFQQVGLGFRLVP
jgi:predicted nucleic acid-binding protein